MNPRTKNNLRWFKESLKSDPSIDSSISEGVIALLEMVFESKGNFVKITIDLDSRDR